MWRIDMVEIFEGPLDTKDIFSRWSDLAKERNFGAFITFVGVVRDEDGIEALSFDIYEPILQSWFENWQKRAKKRGAFIKMAHSKGDVPIHKSSFVAGVFSPKRRVALELIDEFVEDFKANAPIWKYDIKKGERLYAKDRSQKIEGSGILEF
jgi:molybdopterin synthase catalytic subunit